MSSDQFIYAWLIPLFPLIGFVINGLFGKKLNKTAGIIATLMVALSFGVACYLFSLILSEPENARQHAVYLAQWFSVPGDPSGVKPFWVNFELLIDPLSVLMMLIITGVGGLIHLYSTGYMAGDRDYPRFFTYLNLFVFFMLLLVMGNNFLLLFVGWEGVGLCSYLLIGYFYEKKSAGDAAKKAFIMNRIGDVGVLIGMFMIFQHFGTLDFITGHSGVLGIVAHAPDVLRGIAPVVVTTICLMLFLGATGKSAQIPLYTWLPDAMEGPTPVSALIHAATMVTAGIYMVSRVHTFFEASDVALMVVMVIGIATALLAATIGLTQNDIKRVLAYSTVSQLGYMFAACGAGVFAAGMFHVMTHAFFKACLFLGAGSVIHAVEHGMHAKEGHGVAAHAEHGDSADAKSGGIEGPNPHDPQDMRNMGGLWGRVPTTAWTMLIATLAIAGVAPLAGFWSKDEILWTVFNAHNSLNLIGWGILAGTALITTFYMMRLIMKTFFGASRTDAAKNAHENSLVMTAPLLILAFLSIIVGWPITLGFDKFQDFLAPSVVTPGFLPIIEDRSKEHMLGGVVLAAVLVILAICVLVYRNAKSGQLLAPKVRANRAVFSAGWFDWVLLNKYFIDEFNNWVWVKEGRRYAESLKSFDEGVIDGMVNGVGGFTNWAGSIMRRAQTGYVRNYAFSMVIGIIFVLIACLWGVGYGR